MKKLLSLFVLLTLALSCFAFASAEDTLVGV